MPASSCRSAWPEAVEIAWRALLKRHHPDVAGSHADDLAKRINVAHDWLSDPDLRAGYDSERHPGRGRRAGASARTRPGGSPGPCRRPPAPRRPIDPAEAVERHLARVRRLSQDELDRLSLAESPPIAFVASISRFLSADQLAAVEGPATVQDALPPKGRWDATTRDAVLGYAHELLLAPFLDAHLSEPFGSGSGSGWPGAGSRRSTSRGTDRTRRSSGGDRPAETLGRPT